MHVLGSPEWQVQCNGCVVPGTPHTVTTLWATPAVAPLQLSAQQAFTELVATNGEAVPLPQNCTRHMYGAELLLKCNVHFTCFGSFPHRNTGTDGAGCGASS